METLKVLFIIIGFILIAAGFGFAIICVITLKENEKTWKKEHPTGSI